MQKRVRRANVNSNYLLGGSFKRQVVDLWGTSTRLGTFLITQPKWMISLTRPRLGALCKPSVVPGDCGWFYRECLVGETEFVNE